MTPASRLQTPISPGQAKPPASVVIIGRHVRSFGIHLGCRQSRHQPRNCHDDAVGQSPGATGDLLALVTVVGSTSLTVSSVSGGGVTTWNKAAGFDGYLNADEEIWYGKVTSTGSSTVTVAWSGSVSGLSTEFTRPKSSTRRSDRAPTGA